MLTISHPELFSEVVKQAKSATGGEARWCAAIDKAADEIREHPERFEWMDSLMLIFSPTSDEVYQANGSCGCISYSLYHRPCKHRTAARLWVRYLEAVAEHEKQMRFEVW